MPAPKYPWREWFRPGRTALLRGVHYQCSQSAMAQMVRNNASQRGLYVRLEDTGTEIIVEVVRVRRAPIEVPHSDQTPVAG